MSLGARVGNTFAIKQFADYPKVTERRNYGVVAAKKIPAFKVDKGSRFSRTRICRWIKQHWIGEIEISHEQNGGATGQPNNGERK